jgi:hypothetical protein
MLVYVGISNVDNDFLSKQQRDMINQQKKDLEVATKRIAAEMEGKNLAKMFANLNFALDLCERRCKDMTCLRNCVYKQNDSFVVALNVLFFNV